MSMEDVTTTREGKVYLLRANRPGRYRVFWAKSPDGFTDDYDLGVLEDTLRLDAPDDGRLYFHLVDGDYYTVTAERAPDENGQYDLGGYNTPDGTAFVRYGVLLCDAPDAPEDEVFGMMPDSCFVTHCHGGQTT